MDTPELKDPYTWTPAFVKSHETQCLPRLREINRLAIANIQRGDYVRAAALVECMAGGLYTMDEALTGNYRPFIFGYSLVLGILALNVDPFDMCEAMGHYMVDSRGRTVNAREINRKSGNKVTRERMAANYFKNARDFAQTPDARRDMTETVRILERGEGRGAFTPEDSLPYLRDLDERLAEAIAETGGINSAPARRKKGDPADFDDWMDRNGWNEETLEEVIKRVKLRRNIYGVLLLIPMLGIFLTPFWLRAVWLTRAMRSRDIDVGFTFPEKAIMVLYGLPSLFIVPLVLGWLIRWSNWGMGLKDPRGAVLNALFWGSIALLFLWQMISSINPIPFIVCAAFLAVFLVVIWCCRRLRSPVPALVLGGLAAATLAIFLIFGRASTSGETAETDWPGSPSSHPEKILENQNSAGADDLNQSAIAQAVPDMSDQSAMAQAMLEVLDQAMAANAFGEVGLTDMDGDGIEELLVACGPSALLYSWQDGGLTAKEVGGLADRIFLWYLCQDTATGERGLQFESYGGNNFIGGDTAYYYPSHETRAGYRTYYDDGGAVSMEYYYIGDYENEAAKADYQAVREQNQTLEEVFMESWYEQGVQTTVVGAELETIRDGRTFRDMSDEGLLALARIAAYDLPGMTFALDTGAMIPQDGNDYIVVNMVHDGFGKVRAYRALDCTTAADVEAVVKEAWHRKVSRRYPLDYTANVIEYVGQAGDYYTGDLLRYDGALYVVENWELGDGESRPTVDRMFSRTADEAVFQAYDTYGEFLIPLIYEDEVWKYGEWQQRPR